MGMAPGPEPLGWLRRKLVSARRGGHLQLRHNLRAPFVLFYHLTVSPRNSSGQRGGGKNRISGFPRPGGRGASEAVLGAVAALLSRACPDVPLSGRFSLRLFLGASRITARRFSLLVRAATRTPPRRMDSVRGSLVGCSWLQPKAAIGRRTSRGAAQWWFAPLLAYEGRGRLLCSGQEELADVPGGGVPGRLVLPVVVAGLDAEAVDHALG